MCGIAGFWAVNGPSLSEIQFTHFLDVLSHRGPDGRGIYTDLSGSFYLGHRRLAILDLSDRGDQPMSYAGKRYWIVFNGEIYNFLEIRKELEALGHTFYSDSDTEIVLASYVEWGERCQYKFNGMWAFVIWDANEQSLFLSRDRFGVKPLYYIWDGKRLAFASEMKAFSKLAQFKVEFDDQALANVLYDVNCLESTDRSLLHSVVRLPAGHSAYYQKGGVLSVRQWWNTLDHLIEVPKTWDEQVSQFKTLFLDACRLRMRSDVPVGTALSGGLDSSSILAGLFYVQGVGNSQRMPPDWRRVFTAHFPNTSQDESFFAAQMVQYTQTNSFACEIRAESLITEIDRVLYDLEEVFDLPVGPWMLYKHLRGHGTVISIDGHGPDELFGGYHHHVEMAIAGSIIHPWRAREFDRILQEMYPLGSPFQKPAFSSLFKKAALEHLRKIPKAYVWIRDCFRKLGMAKGLQKSWLLIPPETRYYTSEHPRFKQWGLFDQMLYIDFHQKTLPTILRNFDRCSMAHGVEVRAPFLDWRLVCYAFSLNTQAKIGQGFTKRILRDAMKGLLPEEIRTRTAKVGFASPINEWLKTDLKPFVLDSVRSRSFQHSNIWNGAAIASIVETGYNTGNIGDVRAAWEFIQADRLIHLFNRKNG